MKMTDVVPIMVTDRYQVVSFPCNKHRELHASRVYVDSLLVARDEQVYALVAQKIVLGGIRQSRHGKSSKIDEVCDRLNRRSVDVQRELALDVVHHIDDGRYADLDGYFSQYAGCSCPCSPGIILTGPVYVNDVQVDLCVSLHRVDIAV
jgi:hypothetical protein